MKTYEFTTIVYNSPDIITRCKGKLSITMENYELRDEEGSIVLVCPKANTILRVIETK